MENAERLHKAEAELARLDQKLDHMAEHRDQYSRNERRYAKEEYRIAYDLLLDLRRFIGH